MRAFPRILLVSIVGLCFLPISLESQVPGWRLFGGSFNTSWRTEGFHGHSEDCRTRTCERSDFRKGNLDNAIGFRAGAERPLWKVGRLELLAGGELAVIHTEYNLSQRDITMGELLVAGGVSWDFGPARLVFRSGAGVAAHDDGASGLASFRELAAEVPLGGGTAVRVASRDAKHAGPRARDYSILLVMGSEDTRGRGSRISDWRMTWSFGISQPGGAVGDTLSLSSAPFSRLSVHRRLFGENRIGLSFVTTAHESRRRTDLYYGIPGNERGKDIDGVLLTWDREGRAWGDLRWRLVGGIEAASWKDEFGLLLAESGRPLRAGIETAGVGGLEGVLPIGKRIRFVVGAEKLYWFRIGLGELRFRSGVEIAP